MKTKIKLCEDLKSHDAPDWMIRYAIDGHYDDYESDIATPIMQLVEDCERMAKRYPDKYSKLTEISTKAKNGEYDGTKEESEAWFNKEGRQISAEEFLK